MKVLSLFSGGGLGDYGLELSGMEIIGQVEIDEYCQKILSLRWPTVPKWRDICEVKGKEVIERIGQPDLISGGFPCQDLSYAGKGEGLQGKRSGLWSEMFRIICEVKPRYVLVENVSALLGRGLGVVLRDLASVGYDAEWECIPASFIGAPHQRDRVWIVAYPNSQRCDLWECNKRDRHFQGNEERTIEEIQQERSERKSGISQTSETLADTRSKLVSSRQVFTQDSGDIDEWWSDSKKWGINRVVSQMGAPSLQRLVISWEELDTISELHRMVDGTPEGLDRIHLLGNGQVVQVVKWIGERIMDFPNPTY